MIINEKKQLYQRSMVMWIRFVNLELLLCEEIRHLSTYCLVNQNYISVLWVLN